MLIDMMFRIVTPDGRAPRNNAYHVFAGVSRVLGGHLPGDVGVFAISGRTISDTHLALTERSCLGFRCPPERATYLFGLVGQVVEVGGSPVTVGAPDCREVRPSPSLWSRSVFLNNPGARGLVARGADSRSVFSHEVFLGLVRDNLRLRGIRATPSVPPYVLPHLAHVPPRSVVNICGARIVGFPLRLDGLAREDAESLIREGMGGRRHMGGGLFVPAGVPTNRSTNPSRGVV